MGHEGEAREESRRPGHRQRGLAHRDCSAVRTNKFDFDDEATRLIGEAFDAACGDDLHDTGQYALVREIIAKRIVEAAMKGERDPVRLRAAGLAALGYDREAI